MFGGVALAQPQPQLTCQVTYAGATQTVVAQPVADPYSVPSVDIGGRFAFKPVLVGTPQTIERIAIYSYMDTPTQAILVHQVKYLPPFPKSKTAWPITGQHHVYAGPLERELIFSCQLEGWAP